MSVYRPRKADGARQPEFIYDFRFRGHRFCGPTGETEKRKAEAVERDIRERLKTAEIDRKKPLTFGAASTLYWNEVGQFHRNATDTERALAWLQREIGIATPIANIGNRRVAELVAKRRSDAVSPKTVNLQVIEPLRGILRRAADVWDQDVQKIGWKRHALPVKQERVREASIGEEAAIEDGMREDYRAAVVFAMLAGCRRAEIVCLRWSHVDFFNREFTVTGKGDRSRTIPMSRAVFDLLWSLKDDHPDAVFTYVARATRRMADGTMRHRGKRYPVTMEGFKTAWRRFKPEEVDDFRFHDTRHTAASRLVRETGDLRMAQRLLGHQDIATTVRYAHLTNADLRAGLEATHARHGAKTPMETPMDREADVGKPLKTGKKRR